MSASTRALAVLARGAARCGRARPLAAPARAFASDAGLKKTPLYEFHIENGGKMVPFAGWSMPIQYKDSIIDATLHCRSHASLFDVSHMCGVELTGKDAVKFIEGLVVGDIAGLEDGSSTLSVFTNEEGGIIDDTVVTKVAGDRVYLVVNAGCREKDLAHLDTHLREAVAAGLDVELAVRDDRALLALQGPEAAAVLQDLVAVDLSHLYFGQFTEADVDGASSYITRTGYTGEDGFELSIPADKVLSIASRLAADERVRLCGLGPRDSLRLEAGLCLYGNDLDESISPVRAGLTWTVGKRRREAFDFVGGQVIAKQIAEGVPDRRVGLVTAGPPARQHSKIFDLEGNEIGEVTSGAFSPTLKKNLAMGYVPKALGKAGTELKVEVRGKTYNATVTKMPFVPPKYYK